ncbi:MAG TPA: nitroreductase family protein [Vicinamibacterales bacterium]|nr:nitroreductase family protein [Vicinamibacterales bacterium]
MRTTTTISDAIASRHSTRSFTPDAVSEASVRALLQAAVQAPTAMHVEPWRFVVVQDRDALKRYSDVAKATLVKEAELYRDLHDPSLTPKNGGFLRALASPDFNIFYNAGTLVLIGARLTNPFVAGDCWLAAENLMLAAAGMGLGTCCIGSALPAVNSAAVKAELGIPGDVTVIAAIVVGVPADAPMPSARKAPVILTWKQAPHGLDTDEQC